LDSTAGEPAGKVEVSAVRSGQRGPAAKNCALVMKNLVLLLLLGVAGYYGYKEWFDKTDPRPAPAPEPPKVQASPSPPAVAKKSSVHSRVARMYNEWKERTLATEKIQQSARRTDMAVILTEVRRLLGNAGIHSPSAVKEVIVRDLVTMGVAPSEADYVHSGLLSEAEKDGTKGGNDRSF